MQPPWQIPRSGLLWLLVAVATIIAVHFEHLPLWVNGVAVVAILWRIQVYRGAWSYPGRWVKVLLLAICIGGLLARYGRLVGLEPMVALLISGLILKLLEMHRQRDALIAVFLAYFAAIVECLFAQTMAVAGIVLLCLALVTAALVGIHQSVDSRGGAGGDWLGPLRTGGVLLLHALPLMLVLFLVMPRIGSLWAVPYPQHRGTTGVGDSMAPGDFSRLGRSGAVAFRATFTASVPAQQTLYWRGPVLSHFDGRRWTQSEAGGLLQNAGSPAHAAAIERIGEPTRYDVVLEPTNAPWLFALTTPVADTPEVFLTLDSILVRKTPVAARTRYQTRSWLSYRLEAQGLPPWRRALNLALPAGFNPETQRIAQQWREETPEPEALIERLLQLYRREFVYTLTPPLLGTHTVDEFLWDKKQGFCEFYASSFVIFMRAAGIPARVVTGYQGGERHPTEAYLLVHQYDAHAWAEVWLPGKGWVRIDPTAAVAPQRIERTFADLFGADRAFLDGSLFALERYRHWSLLNTLRLRLDSLDYAWGKWVLGYERMQGEVLTALVGRIDPWRIGLFLLIAGAVAMAPMLVMLFFARGRSRHDELDRLFLTFCRRLARVGIVRQSGEGPRNFAARIAREQPRLAQIASSIVHQFERQRYGGGKPELARLRRAVRRFRPR